MPQPERPNRQSIRKRGWDYTAPGYYFVTCNTHENRPHFGAIINGRMVLNEAGRIAEEEWRQSAVLRAGIELDAFVVMPNHVHGLVRFTGPHPAKGIKPQFGKPIAGALGTFVGAYKAAVSRAINRRGLMYQAPSAHSLWHRNYWDVIVRDAQALDNIRRYIEANPRNYDAVMNVGEPRCLGNKALMDGPRMGFLASRGAASVHGRLPLREDEAIISGFLSPMERAVLKAGLDLGKPMIWVKPWGLDEADLPTPVQRALAAGRLLILSPFADAIDAPSLRRAVWCNQYVLAHCTRLVVGHLNPEGMLACLLSEADPETEIVYL